MVWLHIHAHLHSIRMLMHGVSVAPFHAYRLQVLGANLVQKLHFGLRLWLIPVKVNNPSMNAGQIDWLDW